MQNNCKSGKNKLLKSVEMFSNQNNGNEEGQIKEEYEEFPNSRVQNNNNALYGNDAGAILPDNGLSNETVNTVEHTNAATLFTIQELDSTNDSYPTTMEIEDFISIKSEPIFEEDSVKKTVQGSATATSTVCKDAASKPATMTTKRGTPTSLHSNQVKRANIKTVHQARLEAQGMSENSDAKVLGISRIPEAARPNRNDYNTMWNDPENILTVRKSLPVVIKEEGIQPQEIASQHAPQTLQEELPMQNLEGNTPSIKAMLLTIIKTQAEQTAKIELMSKKIEGVLAKLNSVPSVRKEIDDEICFQAIDSIQELNEFEENLRQEDFFEKMIYKFSSIIGKKSLYGHNVSYALVDYIFTRKLFTLVSWAGGSKPGQHPKTCFQQYTKTISFFHKLIQSYDENYTDYELKEFFKSKVIANSTRRLNIPAKRVSRTKSRYIKT